VNANSSRGDVRRDKLNLAGAISDYTKALDFDATYADAYWSRAWAKLYSNEGVGVYRDASQYLAAE